MSSHSRRARWAPMRFARVGAFLVFISPIHAAPHWVRLKTPHFEMYTTNSAASATKSLETFERVRSFFLESSPSKSVPEIPVRIIAFRSEKEFLPYRPNGGALAYYQLGRKRDHIVMQDLSTEHYHTAVHEYTHLIVEHTGMKVPIWLNEGLAEVYSSLEPRGNQSMIGRPIASHLQILAQEHLLDLQLLTGVQRDSPYYNERDKMAIFYAESWALTHMLMLGKQYNSAFPRFFSSITSGNNAETAFRTVYGKTLPDVKKDLNTYFMQNSVQVSVFDVKLEKVSLEPEISDLGSSESELALIDLLAASPGKTQEARTRLNALAALNPGNPELEECFGYLEWQGGKTDAAIEHFSKAVQSGSQEPEMLYHYAMLLQGRTDQQPAMLSALRKALDIRPGYHDARYALGLGEINAHHYGSAMAALLALKTIKPEEAFTVYSALAYCNLQLNEPSKARALALRAKEYAKLPGEEGRVAEMLSYLERLDMAQQSPSISQVAARSDRTKATEPATKPDRATQGDGGAERGRKITVIQKHVGLNRTTGTARQLECRGQRLRLHIQTQQQELIFQIEDPNGIVVRNTNEGYVDWSCGPMKPMAITVLFVPDATGATAGLIREMEF